eukprot:12411406-Karenia_brevis.AAC.1
MYNQACQPLYPVCGPHGPQVLPFVRIKDWPNVGNYPVKMIGHRHLSQGTPVQGKQEQEEHERDVYLEWGGG